MFALVGLISFSVASGVVAFYVIILVFSLIDTWKKFELVHVLPIVLLSAVIALVTAGAVFAHFSPYVFKFELIEKGDA